MTRKTNESTLSDEAIRNMRLDDAVETIKSHGFTDQTAAGFVMVLGTLSDDLKTGKVAEATARIDSLITDLMESGSVSESTLECLNTWGINSNDLEKQAEANPSILKPVAAYSERLRKVFGLPKPHPKTFTVWGLNNLYND